MSRPSVEEEIEYLSDPARWLAWPLAPVKRSKNYETNQSDCGIVVAEDRVNGKFRVWIKNLWALEKGPLMPQLESCEAILYDNLEALVQDGWMVD